MKNTLLTKQTILTTVILGHLYAVPAIAMDTEDKIEKEENLEVITVTSRKKLETILEIPMSISAVSAVEIANRNYLDASDIYRTLAGAAAPRGQLILRGLSGGNSASPDTTAIFTDDIPYEFTNLTDVERVEVLRGPQGTLYGSNAIGGTVRVITKKPQLDEFELFGTIEGSSENNVDGFDSSLSLGVNVPLLDDTLALRVTGNITNDVRPYVNQATGQQSKSQSSFIRSQLLWQPIDNLALNFTYVHDEYSANGATLGDTSKPGYYYELSYDEDASAKYGYDISDTKITCDPTFNRPDCIQGGGFIHGADDKYALYNLLDGWDKESTNLYSLTVDVDNIADVASLTYAGSYRKVKSDSLDDWSRLDASDMFKTWIINVQELSRVTHEIRLQNFDLNSNLSWTVGAYWDKSWRPDSPGHQWQYIESGDRTAAAALYWWGDDAQQIGLDNFDDPNKIWNYHVFSEWAKEFALFADVAYQIETDDFGNIELNAGIRHFNLEDFERTEEIGVWSNDKTLIGGEEQGNRFKFSASWQPTDDYSIYALYSEGYRPGGNNSPLAAACVNDVNAKNRKARFTSDSIDNYEVGLKGSLFDGKFNFSSAIYQINWSDIKTSIYMDSCGFSYTANAGKARSRGLEFESKASLTDTLALIVNASYTNSELTEDNETIGGVKGQEMTMVPKYNAYIAIDKEFDINNKPFFIRGDVSAYGKYNTHFDTKPGDEVPGYEVFNLSARYEVNENVKLSVHLNNVFDNDAIKYKRDRSRSNRTTAQKYIDFLPERSIGIRLDYNFM